MKRTKEDARITRQQLLSAGRKVFGEKGYAASKLTEVAEEAGVTRGAIYHHFKNKQELFVALFKERVDPFLVAAGNIIQESGPAIEKLEKMARFFFDKIKNDKEFRGIQALEFSSGARLCVTKELQDYMVSQVGGFRDMFLKMLQDAQKKREIRPDVSPETIIGTLVTLTRGYAFVTANKTEAPFLQDMNSDEMIKIYLQGIKNS